MTDREFSKARKVMRALIRENTRKQQHELDLARLAVFRAKKKLDAEYGPDEYQDGLRMIIEDAGNEGVNSADLPEIFPDSRKLKKATEALTTEGAIITAKEGMTLLLKLKQAV